MFVQMRHRTITGQRGHWAHDTTKPGLESHRAELLRSYRENGSVRKETVARLGYFTTRDGVLTEKAADEFWRKAMATLARAQVSEADQTKAAEQLATVVRQYVDATARPP